MKKLKLSLVVTFLAMISLVGAQNTSYSIKGGLNVSNIYGDKVSSQKKPGFHFGVGADFGLTPELFLQTGLLFSNKGYKYNVEGLNSTINTNYLQLPVHLAYKIDVTPGTKVVIHAGPYVAYGIGGKLIGDVKAFDKDAGFKPLDFGLGLGVGAEFGVILVDLGWDMGLTNISRATLGSIKTQNAYLSLGYKF